MTLKRWSIEPLDAALRCTSDSGPVSSREIYRRALSIELEVAGLSFDVEKRVRVEYRGRSIYQQRLDLVVENRVLVELKAVERLGAVHRAQVISYLRVTGIRIGLLVDFNVPVLPAGLQRVVL